MSHPLAAAYRQMRSRVLELGRRLDDEAAERVVPCCPAWSVRELFAHLAGVPADIVDGRLDGVTTDPWTQAQVDARAGDSLAAILDELEAKGAVLDGILADGAGAFPPPFFLDAWTHEWDLRQAVGATARPDLSLLDGPFEALLESTAGRLDTAGLGPLDLQLDGTVVRLGSGTMSAERHGTKESRSTVGLSTTRFEFARLALGRRSRDQIGSLDWWGDPAPFVDALVVFSASEHDVIDPVVPADA